MPLFPTRKLGALLEMNKNRAFRLFFSQNVGNSKIVKMSKIAVFNAFLVRKGHFWRFFQSKTVRNDQKLRYLTEKLKTVDFPEFCQNGPKKSVFNDFLPHF